MSRKKEETVPARKRHRHEPSFRDILQVFEAMLSFDKWSRKDTYWADHNAEVSKAIVSRLIAKLMHLSKKYIPTSKSTAWNYPKFHDLMHIVDDISQFGAPQNFCAQQPESLLIVAAKQPGLHAQKCHKGVVYELQAAQRLCYSLMINTVHDRIQNGTPARPPKKQVDTLLNQCLIHKSTKGSTTGISTRASAAIDKKMPIYQIQWDNKTDVSTLQMDNELLHYLYNEFGPVVHICTEYKGDIYTFRCHPNYGSAGSIYDWMIIKFNIWLFPCQLAAVVLDDSTSVKEVHLVYKALQHVLRQSQLYIKSGIGLQSTYPFVLIQLRPHVL